MNVLMISPHPKKVLGGMSTVINNYYSSSLPNKVNITHVSTTVGGSQLNKGTSLAVALIRVLFFLLFKKIDIVHIHSAARGSFIRKSFFVILSKMLCKKVVFHMHGGAFDEYYNNECSHRKKDYVTKILNKCDIIIALGEEWKEKISRYCNSEIDVLHNAINIPEVNSYNNQSKNITLLAKLDKEKGTYDILDIVKDICRFDNSIKFVFAGYGDLDKLNNAIQYLGIESNVNVLGWINAKERNEILKDTLIYLLPSYYEGMPMSILEAMSYGVPVVSTNVGSIPTVIKHGENGFIITPGNKSDLKKYIIELISNAELRKTISKRNYKEVKEKFDVETNIDKLLEIYDRVTNS